jgi:hypothetical protein
MKNFYIGYDCFITAPGEFEEKHCLICNTLCHVHRGIPETENFAMFLAQKNRLSDSFFCPNSGKEWHNQAVELNLALTRNSNPEEANVMKKNLDRILAEHGLSAR